jgi:iron complex outermembrane receptor protein
LRKGFVNNDGVEGALARNENDVSAQLGEYAQGRWRIGRWQVFGGIRHTRVSFDSDDHFITAVDPDDSGSRRFSSTEPVGGLLYKLTPVLNFYANYGRGFETPVFSELAYRPDGTAGFNGDLDPSTSENYEAGLKGDWLSAQFRLAAFHIHTSDEIIVASSSNGRTSFRNAGSTSRNGVELSVDGELGGGWHGYAAYSYLNARFSGGPLADKWLPGVPRDTLYGALTWRYAPLGFSTTLDAQWRSHVYVDEQNSDYAAGYMVADCQLGFRQSVGGWELNEYGRINNLFDRSYIGAVIVDASNGRYFEPAPTRNFIVGLSVNYSF